MNRRTGQLLALLGITILVIAAVWFQSQQGSLRTQLLNQYGYPVAGYGGTATGTMNPEDFAPNDPQSSEEREGIKRLNYLIPFDELAVLDGLQMRQFVPSFTTPVLWESANAAASNIIIDDVNATRTAFIAPDSESELVFELKVANPDGNYTKVAEYAFMVVSPLAYEADVNKDGKYDFQNDLVHLLRNWESFGEDATRTLALILSRLEE